MGDIFLIFAFVLVNAEIGNETKVMKFLREIDEVKEVYSVIGVYDIIAKIKSKDKNELRRIINNNLRKFKAIRSINIMIIIPEKMKVESLTKQTIEILA